jgi:hypothetical protein
VCASLVPWCVDYSAHHSLSSSENVFVTKNTQLQRDQLKKLAQFTTYATLSAEWSDVKTKQVPCEKRLELQRCFQWKLQFRRFGHIRASIEY